MSKSTPEPENTAESAVETPSTRKIYKALTGIDNDDLGIHLAVGDLVPQSLLDHSPDLLTAYNPPVIAEA